MADIFRQSYYDSRPLAGRIIVLRILVVAFAALSLVSCNSSQADADGQKRMAWPPTNQQQIALWPNGAPDMHGISQPAESIEVSVNPERFAGLPVTGVENVSNPTMTIYSPKGRNARVAIVVFPGGGFEDLAIDLEGTEICDWLVTKGITCILSKYRVPKSDDQYDSDCDCHITPKIRRALQDAQRTIRLVRSKAKSLGIDPKKIGVIGFSAGGYLVAETSNVFEPAYKPVDSVDQISSRPDFAIAAYPGHIWRGNGWNMDPSLHVTKQTPTTFILQAWDDEVDGIRQSLIYARALEDAGVPAEVHLFAKGGHAFGLRSTGHSVDQWPSLVEAWLREIGVLNGR
jgi:acetyl esterase/lipase